MNKTQQAASKLQLAEQRIEIALLSLDAARDHYDSLREKQRVAGIDRRVCELLGISPSHTSADVC